MFRHLLPNAMVATLTFLPFILSGSITTPDLARFPRLRPAAGLGLAGRTDRAGQAQPAGAMARADGVLHHLDHAVLLIFIGEATRDAFDPRKTFR
jgi:microcin C transport system permease protein